MNKQDRLFLESLNPCKKGMAEMSKAETLQHAWLTCQRSDWMLWALRNIGYTDERTLRLYACACVRGTPLADGRTVWDLLTDARSKTAVEVAERFARGDATGQERHAAAAVFAAAYAAYVAADAAAGAAYAAADAAYAAYVAAAADDAAGAAYAAAYATYVAAADAGLKAQSWQADLLRQSISWEEVQKAIEEYRRSQ